MVEDALHFHTASRVGDAQGAAGNQAFGRGGPVGGPHQTPVGLVVGPLQHLHRLASADGQLGAVAGGEVVDHHCQLAAAGELGKQRGQTRQRARATGPPWGGRELSPLRWAQHQCGRPEPELPALTVP